MTKVTIPTASYVGRDPDNQSNLLLPELLPAAADFNQQCKLWRFYCTCIDLGCSGYKLEDFEGQGLDSRGRYMYWVKHWRMHYADVSNLIRLYKHARNSAWLFADDQSAYRLKLIASEMSQRRCSKDFVVDNLLSFHVVRMNENLERLKKSAQHLLNARFIGKLAAGALRKKNHGIIA